MDTSLVPWIEAKPLGYLLFGLITTAISILIFKYTCSKKAILLGFLPAAVGGVSLGLVPIWMVGVALLIFLLGFFRYSFPGVGEEEEDNEEKNKIVKKTKLSIFGIPIIKK